jgi:4a-hydroxytetrahydrobiopterin dehydratase
MTDFAPTQVLTRSQSSDAVTDLGWRYVINNLMTSIEVPSMAAGSALSAQLVEAVPDADEHLRVDLRPGRVDLTLSTFALGKVTGRDVALAEAVSGLVGQRGLATDVGQPGERAVQVLEIAIDALDIPSVVPFWQAVMGYGPGVADDPELFDPHGEGPTLWFQQMDEPRVQRNRIHFDIVVPHDEAQRRLDASLAAGGTLVSDAHAPSFWVLADREGNEICICTWQARDRE